MSRRKFDNSILSVLHFDYPYPGEAGDALRDEIGIFSWARNGGVNFSDSIKKFGYRGMICSGTNDYISAAKSYALRASLSYEFSFWIRIDSSSAGNILRLINSDSPVFTLRITSEKELVINGGVNLESNHPLTLTSWHFVRVQVTPSNLNLYIDSNFESVSYSHGDINFDSIQLGGFTGYIDEFIFKSSLTTNIPGAPLQGTLDLPQIGGYGTGKLGNVTINNSCVINSSAFIDSISDSGKTIYLKDKVSGLYGAFSAGEEVMILCHYPKGRIYSELGLYTFRNIISADSNSITIDKPVTSEFSLSSAAGNCNIALIVIPNFNTLTIAANAKLTPASGLGVVAFRCKDNCTINGKIITSGYGPERQDNTPLTHSSIVDKFIIGSGGGIFITCGGTLTVNSSARIGGDWSGNPGYGGNGYYSGHVGWGGNQLIRIWGNDMGYVPYIDNQGGGAPGQNGDSIYNVGGFGPSLQGEPAGANAIIAAKKLSLPIEALSTGGKNGRIEEYDYHYLVQMGGSGTGFAYIACEEVL